MRSYWVYILATVRCCSGKASSFTRKYKVHPLVWFQEYGNVRETIQREKTMKEWPRDGKINLIERDNLHWIDLYPSLPGVRPSVIRGARGWVDRGDKPRDDT